MQSLRAESLFPQLSGSLEHKPTGFQTKYSGGLSPWHGTSDVGLRPIAPWKEAVIKIILPFVGCLPEDMGLTISQLSPSSSSHFGSFRYLYL